VELLSAADEFSELPVRHNEEHLNADLNKNVRFEVDGDMSSPHVKTNLLLQAHFGATSLPIADYLTDTKTVLDNAPRVLQALVDVCGDQGLLPQALLAMVRLDLFCVCACVCLCVSVPDYVRASNEGRPCLLWQADRNYEDMLCMKIHALILEIILH
jgi:hypothetical protein